MDDKDQDQEFTISHIDQFLEAESSKIGEDLEEIDRRNSQKNAADFNEYFKDLAMFEQKYIITSLDERRIFMKSSDAKEELKSVLECVKEVEKALARSCSIARETIEKYDSMYAQYQDLKIDYEDVK